MDIEICGEVAADGGEMTKRSRCGGGSQGTLLKPLLAAFALVSLLVVPSASADVQQFEVDAYQEALDIPPVIAEEYLEIQAEGAEADIGGELEDRTEGGFAGIWFDSATGEYVISVASDAALSAASKVMAEAQLANDYRAQPVKYSLTELEAAQDKVDSDLRQLFDENLIYTSIDPRANSVVVHIASTANEKDRAILAQVAKEAEGKVELSLSREVLFQGVLDGCSNIVPNCSSPLRGGVEIGPWKQPNGGTCTAAFRAVGKTNGKRYLLSAGHCAAEKNPSDPIKNWQARDEQKLPVYGQAKYLGEVEQLAFPAHDWMAVNITGSEWDIPLQQWPSLVAYWGKGSGVAGQPPINAEYVINGQASSIVGQGVCHSGMASGGSCGQVVETNVSYSFGESGSVTHDLVKVKGACSEGGDSGGPWFASNVAYGIHIGKVAALDPCTSATFYEEITDAAEALDVVVGPVSPPKADTQAPSGIKSTQATLNGSVNPNGLSTTYRFEYGPTTSYGFQLPIPDGAAGSGNSTLAKSEVVVGLLSDTTYHYRIVATNAAGTSVGEDQKFTTGELGIAHGWALREPVNGPQWLYYNRSGSGMFQWSWNGSTWSGGAIGGGVASGTTPTVTRDQATGNQWVYYVSAGGSLSQWAWNGSSWNGGTFSGSTAPNTSPSAVIDPTTGNQWVYYVNGSGSLAQWAWNGLSWNVGTFSGSVRTGTSPAAIRSPGPGTQWVYYVNGSGAIALWGWNGTSWGSGTIGGSVATGSSPAVVWDPNTGTQWVYYVNSAGALAEWSWNGSAWNGGVIGGVVAPASSPAVVQDQANRTTWVYYVNNSGGISLMAWDGSKWHSNTLGATGSNVKAGSSPVAIRDPNTGNQWVYYLNVSGGISQWAWNGVNWNGGTL